MMRYGWRGAIAAVAVLGTVAPVRAAEGPAPVLAIARYTISTAAVPMSVGDMAPRSAPAAVSAQGTHLAYTEAAAESGQQTRALASPVWATVPHLEAARRLGLSGVESSLAMRASHPNGPGRAGTNVPGGPSVTAHADGMSALASASASVASVGGFAVAEELAGLSESTRDENAAVGRGVASVGRINVLGGLVALEGVLTRVKVVSDGVKAVIEGTTTVNRVTVDGHPVLLTSAGFVGLPAAAEERLAGLGLTIRVLERVDNIDGPGGSRSVGGVLIGYDSKAARTVLDARRADDRVAEAMPNAWATAADLLLANDQDVTLRFGQVAVHAAASPAAVVMGGAVSAPEGELLAPTADSPRNVSGSGDVTIDGDAEALAAGESTRFLTVADGVGIPVLLVGLALLTAMAMAVPLARLAQDAVETGSARRPDRF